MTRVRWVTSWWDSALPMLLAGGALGLAFFMVGKGYEVFGGWLAVVVGLSGAILAHWLTPRRRAAAPADRAGAGTPAARPPNGPPALDVLEEIPVAPREASGD